MQIQKEDCKWDVYASDNMSKFLDVFARNLSYSDANILAKSLSSQGKKTSVKRSARS